jgi:hypothetical protein
VSYFTSAIFFTSLPSACILFMLNKTESENYRPNYKQVNAIETELNTWCWLSDSTWDSELHLPHQTVLAGKLLHISMPYSSSPIEQAVPFKKSKQGTELIRGLLHTAKMRDSTAAMPCDSCYAGSHIVAWTITEHTNFIGLLWTKVKRQHVAWHNMYTILTSQLD